MIKNTRKINKTFRKSDFVVLGFLILCVFQSFAIFQEDTTLCTLFHGGWNIRLSYILVAFLCLFSAKLFRFSTEGVLLALSVLNYWLLENIHSYGQLSILTSTIYLLLIPYLFIDKNIKRRVYEEFYKLFYWIAFFGIIIFVIYILNILPPFSIVDYYDDDMLSSNYANYYLGYLFVTDYGLTRLCGLFNEPGFLGTLALLMLVSDRFKINKKNVVILIAGLLTFSLAFLVLLIFYFVVSSFLNKRFTSFFILILLVVTIVILSSIEVNDSNISFLLQRVFPEDGGLLADNRVTDDLERAWSIFINDSDKLWFGYGPTFNVRGSAFKVLLMKDGIVGITLIFAPFLLACLKLASKNKDSVLLILVFILSIYQRPQIFNLVYFVILIGGLLHLKSEQYNTVNANS